jgi:hypothetical protein
LSIKAFKRVFWIVLDGMGYEQARRCVDAGRFPSLSRVSKEGFLGPSAPSSPGCQTPSALYTLFSGDEPARSGIWGYRMPDPARNERTISGFHGRPPSGSRTAWQVLSGAGKSFSVMNVAFRADPVWSGTVPGTDFAYDGYRMFRWPSAHALGGGPQTIEHQGLELRLSPTRDGVVIRKGRTLRTALGVGEGRVLRFSAGAAAYALLLRRSLLALSPLSPALVRGSVEVPGARSLFPDANAFRLTRGADDISVETEMQPSRMAMQPKLDLMLETIKAAASHLVVGYFPVIDEFNHVYAHQLQASWPEGRVSKLFSACALLVDECIGRVMAEADEDTAVVISSDHGIVPQGRELHLNEILAAAGLVKRAASGYDLARSDAYYHLSDCGLVLCRPGAPRGPTLARLLAALERLKAVHGIEIAHLADGFTSPHLAFLYPMDDTGLTGGPPRIGRPAVNTKKQGGHHLSPLTPTPWIQATLGAWTPRKQSPFAAGSVPTANRDVSRYLLGLLEGET